VYSKFQYPLILFLFYSRQVCFQLPVGLLW
jgi:hypothetical protein